jgi:hypothetical protein
MDVQEEKMVQNAARKIELADETKDAVRKILDLVEVDKGFVKPMVASLAGDVEVEEAAEYLYQNGIPAYAYSTELPVEVLGAKYKWARGAGLL